MVAQTVKRLSTMRETWVWSLGREDSLQKEMATHSGTLAWKIPWRRSLVQATVHGVAKSRARLRNFTSSSSNKGMGFPWWLSAKESACQCRRHRFDPWVMKIHWRRKWQPDFSILAWEILWTEELAGYSPWGHKSQTQLSDFTTIITAILSYLTLSKFRFFICSSVKLGNLNTVARNKIPIPYKLQFSSWKN